jgi:S1-C subfamily serine protease
LLVGSCSCSASARARGRCGRDAGCGTGARAAVGSGGRCGPAGRPRGRSSAVGARDLARGDDALLADARLVPEGEGGVRLFGLRRESPLARLGLQNGDTVHDIDGRPVSSGETLVGALAPGRDASELRIALSRAGERRELVVRVLD